MTLTGAHDLATVADVRRALLGTSAATLVVLDLAGCTLIDACVIAAIVNHARVTQLRGAALVVKDASGIVLRDLTLTGVTRLMPVYANERP